MPLLLMNWNNMPRSDMLILRHKLSVFITLVVWNLGSTLSISNHLLIARMFYEWNVTGVTLDTEDKSWGYNRGTRGVLFHVNSMFYKRNKSREHELSLEMCSFWVHSMPPPLQWHVSSMLSLTLDKLAVLVTHCEHASKVAWVHQMICWIVKKK